MAGKPIRLGKAAGELNVGIPTIVEFLGSKGIVIDPTPHLVWSRSTMKFSVKSLLQTKA